MSFYFLLLLLVVTFLFQSKSPLLKNNRLYIDGVIKLVALFVMYQESMNENYQQIIYTIVGLGTYLQPGLDFVKKVILVLLVSIISYTGSVVSILGYVIFTSFSTDNREKGILRVSLLLSAIILFFGNISINMALLYLFILLAVTNIEGSQINTNLKFNSILLIIAAGNFLKINVVNYLPYLSIVVTGYSLLKVTQKNRDSYIKFMILSILITLGDLRYLCFYFLIDHVLNIMSEIFELIKIKVDSLNFDSSSLKGYKIFSPQIASLIFISLAVKQSVIIVFVTGLILIISEFYNEKIEDFKSNEIWINSLISLIVLFMVIWAPGSNYSFLNLNNIFDIEVRNEAYWFYITMILSIGIGFSVRYLKFKFTDTVSYWQYKYSNGVFKNQLNLIYKALNDVMNFKVFNLTVRPKGNEFFVNAGSMMSKFATDSFGILVLIISFIYLLIMVSSI